MFPETTVKFLLQTEFFFLFMLLISNQEWNHKSQGFIDNCPINWSTGAPVQMCRAGEIIVGILVLITVSDVKQYFIAVGLVRNNISCEVCLFVSVIQFMVFLKVLFSGSWTWSSWHVTSHLKASSVLTDFLCPLGSPKLNNFTYVKYPGLLTGQFSDNRQNILQNL